VDAAAILGKMHDVLNARQVIGDPYEKNGTTVLPVVSIRGGGGGGGGEPGQRAPGGVGGGIGLTARPLGAYVIRGDHVSWVPAIDVNGMVLGGQFVAVIALLAARSIVRARTKPGTARGVR
jgi:uncharacterized spore protein YtfJ